MDLTIPISGGAIAFCVISVLAWFLKQKMSKWDKHLEDCNTKSVNHAVLESKVNSIDEKVDDLKASYSERAGKIDRMDEKIDMISGVLMRRFGE